MMNKMDILMMLFVEEKVLQKYIRAIEDIRATTPQM
jgi:hypothetical protein